MMSWSCSLQFDQFLVPPVPTICWLSGFVFSVHFCSHRIHHQIVSWMFCLCFLLQLYIGIHRSVKVSKSPVWEEEEEEKNGMRAKHGPLLLVPVLQIKTVGVWVISRRYVSTKTRHNVRLYRRGQWYMYIYIQSRGSGFYQFHNNNNNDNNNGLTQLYRTNCSNQ